LFASKQLLFPKIKFALKGRRLRVIEDIQKKKKKKKSDEGPESCSTTRVTKMFPTVARPLPKCIAAKEECPEGDSSQ
jgi:hypothetical protein